MIAQPARRTLGVALGATLFGVMVGAAASLDLTAPSLGAATTTTPRCVTTDLTILPVLTTGVVTSVTVATLPAACGGATLKVTVVGAATVGSGSLVVPGGGGSVTVPITGGPALIAAIQTDLVLEGP